jgi:cytidylate kinase
VQFITITRKLGANGTRIAQMLADKLGFTYYDNEAINKKAEEMGLLGSVEDLDHKYPSIIQRIFSEKPKVGLHRLASVIYEMAKRGNVLFVGRGSQVLLKPYHCAFNIMVTASQPTRIKNLIQRGFSQEMAAQTIDKSDHDRALFLKYAFELDWNNAELYDVVINTDKIDTEMAVEMIFRGMQSEEFKHCYLDSMQSIEKMALERRIDAALEEGLPGDESALSFTYGSSLKIEVEADGRVTLTGFVHYPASKAKVLEIVSKVEGVRSVSNELSVLSVTAG